MKMNIIRPIIKTVGKLLEDDNRWETACDTDRMVINRMVLKNEVYSLQIENINDWYRISCHFHQPSSLYHFMVGKMTTLEKLYLYAKIQKLLSTIERLNEDYIISKLVQQKPTKSDDTGS